MAQSQPRRIEAYTLIVDAHKLTSDEHRSLREMLDNFLNIINGFTPYEAYLDPKYSDDINPGL